MPTAEPFTVIIDSREQLPYSFPPEVKTVTRKLDAGDYAVDGLEHLMAVERKSANDICGTLGNGRTRFIRELERMQSIKYRALVIEADWRGLRVFVETETKMSWASVRGSLLAMNYRYGINLFPCTNRRWAEALTYQLLRRVYLDAQEPKCQKLS